MDLKPKLRSGGAASSLCVFNQTRQTFLSLDITVADNPWSRLRGLLGRRLLRTGDGVWVVPSRGVHTVGLLFPIDVIYLNEGLIVVHQAERVPPFRIAPIKVNCYSVLELAIRTIHRSDTHVGDQLRICSSEEIHSYGVRKAAVGNR